ncbi:GerAB/ArcD/ProY family transporter [Mycoplasmatota bacterium]|nr:GerAB/ArcD/ProY family transporter [Mycoplasmatota bacterium]
MLEKKRKISVRQLMIISILTIYAPSARYLPTQVAGDAKQAGWLSPLIAFLIYMIVLYASSRLFNKCKHKSYAEILNIITSKYIGKLLLGFYIVWVTYYIIWYVRFYGETLVTMVYANVNINIFIIIILILVSIIIKSGIVVIGRMSEVIFLIVTLATACILSLLIPNIKIDSLTPISTLDTLPILKGSLRTIINITLPFLYFFNQDWSRTNDFLKEGFKAGVYILILQTLIVIASIGNLGHVLTARSSLSFWITVKQIDLLGFMSGFESLLLSVWLLADFILIAILIYSALNMFKSFFNLKDFEPFVNIYLVIIYLLSLIIVKSIWELSELSDAITLYISFFYATSPVLIFVVGKIRKKV